MKNYVAKKKKKICGRVTYSESVVTKRIHNVAFSKVVPRAENLIELCVDETHLIGQIFVDIVLHNKMCVRLENTDQANGQDCLILPFKR